MYCNAFANISHLTFTAFERGIRFQYITLFMLSDLKYCLDKYVYLFHSKNSHCVTINTKHVEKIFWLNPNWHEGGDFPLPILFGLDFVS